MLYIWVRLFRFEETDPFSFLKDGTDTFEGYGRVWYPVAQLTVEHGVVFYYLASSLIFHNS